MWLLMLVSVVSLASTEIILHDADGNVLSDQYVHDPYLPDSDPYASDGWMNDWNQDWALLSGRAHQPKCVDIPTNLTLCKQIGYTQMRLPNLLEHDTLQEVTSQAKSWNPLLGIRCHPDTKLFLCSLFSPVCLDRPIWPCRSLCNSVKDSCQGFMQKYGYPWPEMLRCDKFPLDNDLCIGLQNENKPDDRVCEACNKPDTFEGIIDNFCSAEFVLRVQIAESVISEGYIKITTQSKKRAYKKGDMRKRDLQDLVLYIEEGATCDCSVIDEITNDPATYFLVMGRRQEQRLVLSYVQKYDKRSRDMRRSIKAMRDGDICAGGISALPVEEEPDVPSRPEPSVENTRRNRNNRNGNRGRERERDRNRESRREGRRKGRKNDRVRGEETDRDRERNARRRARKGRQENRN